MSETKPCRNCTRDLPLSAFGLHSYYKTHGARDGKNIICLRCNSKISEANRKGRELRRQPKRKPNLLSRAMMKKRIKETIRNPRTPEEIAEITGYDEQIISDILAHLYDADLVKVAQRRFQLVA